MASYGAGEESAQPSDWSDVPEAGPFRRGALVWRRWRGTRPFWGGLLIILGGGEILLSEQAPLPIVIHVGIQGLAGYLVPAVLVLCGLLLWLNPMQQTFYSVLAVVLALGSWITSNLGGFFVGMLLGVLGGALAFAWSSGTDHGPELRIRLRRPGKASSAGLSLILDDEKPPPRLARPVFRRRHGRTAKGVPSPGSERGQREPPEGNGGASGRGAPTGSAFVAVSAVPVMIAVVVPPQRYPLAGT